MEDLNRGFNMMYYSVSKDGIVNQSNLLSDLPKLETTLCYLQIASSYEYKTQYGNTYPWHRYEFVDCLGNTVSFKIGSCEAVYIANDSGSYYLKARHITIRDHYGREGVFIISGHQSDGGYHNLNKIATKLVPFMLKLSAIGGWDAYKSLKGTDNNYVSESDI